MKRFVKCFFELLAQDFSAQRETGRKNGRRAGIAFRNWLWYNFYQYRQTNRDLRRIVTMIELNTFKKLLKENEECLPLLTLDEFFNGNTEEDSIAPNQWEFGRPTLSEIWDMLQKIELMPNIAWVRVALHNDTEIVENNGAEELALAGDTIVVCTTILPTELEKLVNCEWLCSDGVITIEASELNTYSCVPPIPENYNCLEIVWD